jgi:hypothetical protein
MLSPNITSVYILIVIYITLLFVALSANSIDATRYVLGCVVKYVITFSPSVLEIRIDGISI